MLLLHMLRHWHSTSIGIYVVGICTSCWRMTSCWHMTSCWRACVIVVLFATHPTLCDNNPAAAGSIAMALHRFRLKVPSFMHLENFNMVFLEFICWYLGSKDVAIYTHTEVIFSLVDMLKIQTYLPSLLLTKCIHMVLYCYECASTSPTLGEVLAHS